MPVCSVIWKLNYNSFVTGVLQNCASCTYYCRVLKNGSPGYSSAHCMVPGNSNSAGYKNSSCLYYLRVQKLLSYMWVYIGSWAVSDIIWMTASYFKSVWASTDSVPCSSMSDSSVTLDKVLFPCAFFLLPIVCLVCLHCRAFQGKSHLLLLSMSKT